MKTITSRYEQSSDGHVWIRPEGGTLRAREFRIYNSLVQERKYDVHNVVKWEFIKEDFDPKKSVLKCLKHSQLLETIEGAHKAYLSKLYIAASRGE